MSIQRWLILFPFAHNSIPSHMSSTPHTFSVNTLPILQLQIFPTIPIDSRNQTHPTISSLTLSLSPNVSNNNTISSSISFVPIQSTMHEHLNSPPQPPCNTHPMVTRAKIVNLKPST